MNKPWMALRPYWQARSAKERRALKLLLGVLLLAGLVQLTWQAQQSRRMLRQQVPRLATEAEHMRQQLQAWQSLAATQEKTLPPLPRREVEQRLRALDNALKIAWTGEAQLEISGEAPFDAWLTEIGDLQRDYRLHVVRLQALPAAPGRVTLNAQLGREDAP